MSMSKEELASGVARRMENGGDDVLTVDSEIIEFLLDNCEIEIPLQNRFFGKVDCERLIQSVWWQRTKPWQNTFKESELFDGAEALAYTGACDFSHTNTEWESVISLGICGLRERIADYAKNNAETSGTVGFYKNLLKCYDAALRFMKRVADKAAELGKVEMADGLTHLCSGAPRNLFEALQTSIIYYTLMHHFEGTYLRTLGRIDKLFYPYFVKEEPTLVRGLLESYMEEIDLLRAPSNIPFALSGTDENGNDLTNELSYLWLDVYEKAQTNNTKLHVLCSKKTPEDIIEKALRCVRGGNNSIVFMSDERVITSLEKQGAEHVDAVNYHVVGCYECGAEGELTCSCNARVNVPKALELALNDGRDMQTGHLIGLKPERAFESYDDLVFEFERQLRYFCECAMKITSFYESHYREIHSSPFLSGAYTSALEKGGDLYCDYTAKYNNSSLNAIGLATATDSLAAIRKLVYEDKVLSLSELVETLKNDWKDREPLRLLVKNKYPKYGQGNKKTDAIAKKIVDVLSDAVSYKENVRGGNWRLGLFSIDWRWQFGEKTAASADGRRSGETVSQNTSASFGADKEGATAHLISGASIDTTKTPNGAILDIDLHSSAVNGENGIKALLTSLKTYFDLGGFAVQYNIMDTEILKDAKINPEKYPSLQVRLCGWNVLFSSLSEKEKDEFIARSIK